MMGKTLTDSVHLERFEQLPLPAQFFFAYPKENISSQKIMRMKNRHGEGIEQATHFLTQAIDSIESLFKEVSEDLEMACSLEGRVPCPPSDSNLYLKHCDGRELQADAATPRSNEEDSHDEDITKKSKSNASGVSFEAGGRHEKIERY